MTIPDGVMPMVGSLTFTFVAITILVLALERGFTLNDAHIGSAYAAAAALSILFVAANPFGGTRDSFTHERRSARHPPERPPTSHRDDRSGNSLSRGVSRGCLRWYRSIPIWRQRWEGMSQIGICFFSGSSASSLHTASSS